MTRHALLAGLAALSLFGCFNVVDGGPEVSETRTVEPFTRVRVDDGIPATFAPGVGASVAISTQQKVLENLQTSVKDGQLIVQLKPGIQVNSFAWTEIVITGEGVTALEATGGSKLTATGLDVALRVTASGGSQVTVSGRSADARLSASGGSKVAAFELAAEVASVDASGGSTLEVAASKSVEGTASGGSRVIVAGNGDVAAVSTTGGSTVTYRE